MCLIKKSYIPRFAWKDIEVYKILRPISKDVYETPFIHATVTNKIKSKRHPLRTLFKKEVKDEGVHAFNAQYVAHLVYEYNIIKYSDYNLYKCIIPQGSWYYIGDRTDIASNYMIVKEKIE